MFVSTTDKAWEYLRDLPKHPHRIKEERIWTGTKWVRIEHEPSAKGLSKFLRSFFFNPNPSLPDTENYSQVYPFVILPESFIDAREEDWHAFDLAIPPGAPVPFSDAYDYYKQKKDYTMWSNGDPCNVHNISFPPDLVKYITPIVDYWHISLSQYPRTSTEKFSALLNAIGLKALDHTYLHKTLPAPSNNLPSTEPKPKSKRKLRFVRRYNIPAPGQPRSPYTPYPYTQKDSQ